MKKVTRIPGKKEVKEKKKRIGPKVKPSINACQFCGKIFRFRNSMLRHERAHSGLKYECKKCNGSYTTKFHLSRHYCKADPNYTTSRILCTECGKGFASKQSLSEHMETDHGEGVPSLTCPDCGKGFYGQLSLNRHLSRVHHMTRVSF